MTQSRSVRFKAEVDELADFWIRAQIPDLGGALYQQADISSIGLSIYELDGDTATTAIYTDTPVVADTFFDTGQSWDKDSTGFNFEFRVAQADLAPVTLDGGQRFRVVFLITTDSEGVVPLSGTVTIAGIF